MALSSFASNLNRPRGLAFNNWSGSQSLFIGENGSNIVKRYSTSGTLLSSFNTATVGVSDISFMRGYTPVPEPTGIVAVAAGLALLVRRRR